MKIVIRCDASVEIGGGHVVRCLALATALQQNGAEVHFAVSNGTSLLVKELASGRFRVDEGFSGSRADVAHLAAIHGNSIDALIIDHYGLDHTYETACREVTPAIIAIDDAARRQHDCDILLDATLGRAAGDYGSYVPQSCRMLCGSSYALLRDAFARLRDQVEPPGHVNPRILVSFGMTDSKNVTALALRALSGIDGLSGVVVLGAAAPHIRDVRALLDGLTGWTLITDADASQMAASTAQCDLVLGAPGSASYERCCLGRPAILIQIADNQAQNAVALVQAGCAISAGVWPQPSVEALRREIAKLLQAPERLHAMHIAALKVTDGRGAPNVAQAIFDKISTNSN